MPMESFDDPHRGMDREVRSKMLMEKYASMDTPKRQNINEWPKVCDAICRGDQFVIATSSPTFKATLRFFTDKPDAGDYEIHYQKKHLVDKGRTLKVTVVQADEKREPESLLTPYAYRYAIVTAANDRSRTHMMWLVGLNNVRNVVMGSDD
jgi:hypothetical protein